MALSRALMNSLEVLFLSMVGRVKVKELFDPIDSEFLTRAGTGVRKELSFCLIEFAAPSAGDSHLDLLLVTEL